MGNVSSKPDDGAALYLRDQDRSPARGAKPERSSLIKTVSITSLIITNPRKRSTINITPNAFPASSVCVSRPNSNDNAPIEYVQDPEPTVPGPTPNFLLKLSNDDELIFTFTFVIRRDESSTSSSGEAATCSPPDTNISGLTFVYASSSREVDNLLTREFHADPNLHRNANVALVGDYSTSGSSSVTFEWTWKWKPPKPAEDQYGGWRNTCSFVEYDPRAHSLNTLSSFSYWVSSAPSILSQPNSPSPSFLLGSPPKIRVASAQSVESRIVSDPEEPPSPITPLPQPPTTPKVSQTKEPVKVDLLCPKFGEDVMVSDDGPVFRATLKALEQKTSGMRHHMKKVLKKAEAAHHSQMDTNEAWAAFFETLKEASSTNANAVQPALEHYFDKIGREILTYQRLNAINLQKTIIEPISKLYQFEIKQADAKKRDFEEESKDYYNYVSRYLGQRQDSVKHKKLVESDSKYQNKRRNFELKRFDYSSFVQDLHGGRKEQEVLSHLTKYADSQANGFLRTAKKIEDLIPQLDALMQEVQETDKEYQYQKKEREEKRRLIEKNALSYNEPESSNVASTTPSASSGTGTKGYVSDSDMGRADSTGSQLRANMGNGSNAAGAPSSSELSRSPGSLQSTGSGGESSKFKGIRDLEDRTSSSTNVSQRKEGLLWALNRQGSHVDPRNLNKQGWHKFWIVLDQGKLSEYSNWKQKLDLHTDPIDLRMASVREARNAERRFCFEVITPNSKRVYQATSEEDMNNWIVSINNALQSAVEGRGYPEKSAPPASSESNIKRDIGSVLTGKSYSLGHSAQNPLHHHQHTSSSSGVPIRRTTVGSRPTMIRTSSSGYDENPDKLLQMVRENDQGNQWCADCGSGTKVEWVSINLGIILCIECSGIHRSLGTHISKVRSLTLDIKSFTVDIVEILLLIGNRISNMVWEAKLEPGVRPGPQASREQRLKYITAKYVDRIYVEPSSAAKNGTATPEDMLLAAIKRNEIQQVVQALALRANPNTVDKMRGTHAVWLALAAADPASPSASTGGAASEDNKVVPFPVAELLIQNGAEIPTKLPQFPLGRHAQQFVEQKRPSNGGSADSVPTLPPNMSTSERLQREKEARLQKRVSAGGRLAKSPIPER